MTDRRPLPLEAALDRVGDRWSLLVVEAMLDGPRRFGELAETLSEPHLSARGTFVVVDGVQQAAAAPRFSRTPAGPPTAPGVVGADLDAVRRDWGLPGR